jgi:hypothetical protein
LAALRIGKFGGVFNLRHAQWLQQHSAKGP